MRHPLYRLDEIKPLVRGGRKCVEGRKRHVLVDTVGPLPPAVAVTAADAQDKAGAPLALSRLGGAARKLRRVWADPYQPRGLSTD